jgi:hypothetical protein
MRLAHVHPGDRIEAKVKDVTFTASVVGKERGLLKIEPDESWVTWRCLTARAVVKRLDPVQTSLTEGGAA